MYTLVEKIRKKIMTFQPVTLFATIIIGYYFHIILLSLSILDSALNLLPILSMLI